MISHCYCICYTLTLSKWAHSILVHFWRTFNMQLYVTHTTEQCSSFHRLALPVTIKRPCL